MIQKSRIFAMLSLILIVALFSMNTAAFFNAPSMGNDVVYAASDDEGDKPEVFVKRVYLKNDKADNNGKKHYVGEDSDSKYKTLEIDEKGETIQLLGYYTTNKSSVIYATADGGSPLGEIGLTWTSSNTGVATVSPDGKITPKSDGTATITAEVSEKDKDKCNSTLPSKSVTINISGQTGEYVSNVRIIDKDGNSLSSKDDAVTVISGKDQFFDFYAEVTWHDPNSGSGRTESTRNGGKISSSIKWFIGGSNVAGSINEDSGRFKSSDSSANCYVQCVVTGGKGGKDVKDTANVQVDTGEYKYNPANSLKLKVVYQEYPDTVVQEHTYSLSQLAKLPQYTNSYTIMGGTRYGTIRAKGYLFKDIVGLEGVAIEDVYQFRFNTADGYDNPVTAKMLYGSGSRYYFPNWDIGSKSGSSVVPPILATESNMIWGQSEISGGTSLDEGTRFRLVFGTLWDGGSTSSYQIYYIKGITIVLKGAPPADKGRGDSKGNGGSGNGNGIGSGGKGVGTGSGDGSIGAGTDGKKKGKSGSGGSTRKSGSLKSTKNDKSSGDWTVYEMMSNNSSSVNPLGYDIEYLPAAIPVACGGVVAGSLTCLVGFKRRMS